MSGAVGIGLAARALGAGAARSALSSWAAIPPKVKLAVLVSLAAIALFFLHQHYAASRISAAAQEAREQQFAHDQAALNRTVANYRTAAVKARLADKANADRVVAEAKAINERNVDEYQARLARADAEYQRMRAHAAAGASADRGGGGTAAMPAAGADRSAPVGPASEDRFSLDDRYLATKQAIQLDQLIKAVKGVQAIDPNGKPQTKP